MDIRGYKTMTRDNIASLKLLAILIICYRLDRLLNPFPLVLHT